MRSEDLFTLYQKEESGNSSVSIKEDKLSISQNVKGNIFKAIKVNDSKEEIIHPGDQIRICLERKDSWLTITDKSLIITGNPKEAATFVVEKDTNQPLWCIQLNGRYFMLPSSLKISSGNLEYNQVLQMLLKLKGRVLDEILSYTFVEGALSAEERKMFGKLMMNQ